MVTDTNGLIYMRARYYSPELRRFVNADVIPGTISQAVTLNRYAYANGNPVSNVDPFGLAAEDKSSNGGWYTDGVSNGIHIALDLLGFIPGVGIVTDGASAVIYRAYVK